MGNQIQKKFKKDYNLDLLLISAEDYNVGYVVEYDNGKLDVENYSFISDLLIDEAMQKEFKELIYAIKPIPAKLAELKIDKSVGFDAQVPIPNIGLNIGGSYATKSIRKFTFENITKKCINGELKEKLRKIIQKAKNDNKKYYRKELKNLYIFDELYYSDKMLFEMENTNETEINANFKKLNIEPKISQHSATKYTVEISGNNLCPFAAKIEPLKDYID